MIQSSITVEANITDPETGVIVSGDDLSAFCDALMEALVHLAETDPDMADPSVGVTLSTGEIQVDITVAAAVAEDAFVKGVGSIRAAVHEAGGRTPGWELDVLNGRLQREDGTLAAY